MKADIFRAIAISLATCAIACCGGCSADTSSLGPTLSGALKLVGIGKTDTHTPRQVPLSIAAASNLNAGKGQRPLSLIVKVYALKDAGAFGQAPFDAFLNEDSEKRALGSDILSVREITLIPGQRYKSTESIAGDAQAVGVVALFQSPAAQRWRVTFDPARLQKTGIALDVQACAMSVSKGQVIGNAPGASSGKCG